MLPFTRFFLSIAFFIFPLFINAQILVPLYQDPAREVTHSKSRLKTNFVPDTISIPFFEDFSASPSIPDTAKWFPQSGVYINNRYPVNPPSYNAATFDGLKENGTPYNFFNQYAKGLADSLKSLYIDLSALTPGDSVYLSFYWQSTGNGETADTPDSLRLQFRDNAGKWKTVWSVNSDTTAVNNKNKFTQVMLGLKDPKYFHKGFQFRFQNFGRLSGSFDVWNVDYIYLDKGRTNTDLSHHDLAIKNTPGFLTERYSAIPYNHFFAGDINAQLKDSVSITFKNLSSSNLYIVQNNGGTLVDLFSKTTLDNIDLPPASSIGPGGEQVGSWKPDPSKLPNNGKPLQLKYTFRQNTGDVVFNGVDYRVNDSVSGRTDITEYFAYDDGNAEFGIGIGQFGFKTALKYEANILDTITHIDIYFAQLRQDVSNTGIELIIWKQISESGSDATDVEYAREGVYIQYSSGPEFTRYQLTNPIVLTDKTFYIGYQQYTTDLVAIGYDKNSVSNPYHFYYLNGAWNNFTDESGALMIRPVFSKGFPLENKKPLSVLNAEVFPNPATDQIFVKGNIKTWSIVDLAGKTMLTGNNNSTDLLNIDTSPLAPGIYLLQITDGQNSGVEKIIISR